MMTKQSCSLNDIDFDFFLVLPHLEQLPASEREAETRSCVAEALECTADFIEEQMEANRTRSEGGFFLGSIAAFQRSEHAITIYVERMHIREVAALQFVGYYSSVAAVIETFDIGCCQVVIDGDRFYATKKGAIALATATNIVTQHDLSPQYIYRLGKYFRRGMQIVVPVHCEAERQAGAITLWAGEEYSKHLEEKIGTGTGVDIMLNHVLRSIGVYKVS